MIRNAAQRRPRPLFRSRLRQSALFHRPAFDRLEDRTMLDSGALPAAIVVGRTLATPSTAATSTPPPSYFIGEVENNQVTITYTVYNQQADTETGVLLTDTLEPGVSVVSSSVTLDGTTTTQLPDQSGQSLAWSLAPIQGYDRESVALTVNLPALGAGQTTPFAIDSGAQAYAMLDAGAVSASTPAATIQPGNVSDPSLLAATVDADTNDPFIQEEAAALNYDPTQIFNFLHTQIGYNSYLGSVRGARGALWSNAGNALDVASLGVALMRASGIPAQYVSGTLSQSQAQQLILSMFPPQYQTVGYVPAGTQVSDPANDPQLLAETESHHWFQFNTGSGMVDADPLIPGATIGQTFTTSTGTFTAVPQNLEATTEIQLVAEIYSQAGALFGLSSGLQDTTVLDQTFDDAELVGRPLTIGNLVSTTTLSAIFSETIDTYTPYLDVGDDADLDPTQDQVITGQSYQDVLTDFPLATQVLTGLFLNITTSEPGAGGTPVSDTVTKTILDQIGFAARQGDSSVSTTLSQSSSPAVSEFDLTTLLISSSLQPASTLSPRAASVDQLNQELSSATAGLSQTNPAQNKQSFLEANNLSKEIIIQSTSTIGEDLLVNSDTLAKTFQDTLLTQYYFGSPRIVAVSGSLVNFDPTSNTANLQIEVDLLSDTPRVYAAPYQSQDAAKIFQVERGVADSVIEGEIMQQFGAAASAVILASSAYSVFNTALSEGIAMAAIDLNNLDTLSSLPLSDDAKARITQRVEAGEIVVVPTAMVQVGGTTTVSWIEMDPSTGNAVFVSEDGVHQGIIELGVSDSLGPSEEFQLGYIAGFATTAFLAAGIRAVQAEFILDPAELKAAVNTELQVYLYLLASIPPTNVYQLGFVAGASTAIQLIREVDPPVESLLYQLPTHETDQTTAPVAKNSASAAPDSGASGDVRVASVSLSGQLQAGWNSSSVVSFSISSLASSSGTVADASGTTIGSGAVALNGLSVAKAISGSATYSVTGSGDLSIYGPSENALGVSGDWQDYTATVTGGVSITLTVPAGALTLGGTALPAGTYTVTTSSATLSGSGNTSSPNFSGSVSITSTNGIINLGPGTGTLSVGGKPLDPDDETTLDGYTGTINVSANDDGTDSVSLGGSAGNVLQVTTSPATLTTDQNTPITFATNVQTSLADTYNLTANAPTGWTVSIDSSGNVTATPAPGLQSGTYPIQIIAQSQTDSNLVAQTTVEVTITPTQPRITFAVNPDTEFTVPFNGAQLPTAFRATIQNLGPDADTYNLTFSNLPTGFTILNSGTSVTVPAGETGILGIYLQPTAGQPIPPDGSQVSFTVTATSTTDSSITQTQTEAFTVPDIDAVTATSDPTSVNTTPGTPVSATLTLTDVGNVPETVSLAATLSSGLTASALTPVTLAVGQSTIQVITLTPAASTPLNTTLQATITTTFGPSASPGTQTVQIPVSVVVPGAAAIANAAVAAGQLGNSGLADQLNDLSTALTNLVENPTSPVYSSQAQASLTSLISQIANAPFVSAFAGGLATAQAALAAATTAAEVDAAVTTLGQALNSLATTLSDEALYGFTIDLPAPITEALPGGPMTFEIDITNNGSAAATYDLSISSLPPNVTASFSQSSVTVQPGQTLTGTAAPTVTLTESGATLVPFPFSVTATAEGAPEIELSASGQVTLRNESILVKSVTTSPPFTNPGGQVDVTAQVQSVVNEPKTVEVSYTASHANGNVLFTSTPVPAALTVSSALTTVDLGNLDTTGFADGSDTISVTVTDQSGTPIPGATGQGSLVIGQPVTGTLSTSPAIVPTGSDRVTTTLSVTTQATYPVPLNLQGAVSTPAPGTSVALYTSGGKTYAYESGTGGIDDIDVTDPTNPQLIEVFGQNSTVTGSLGFNVARVVDGYLFVATTTTLNASGFNLLVFSLADPANPTLVSNTSIDYRFLADLLVNSTGTAAFVPTDGEYFFSGGTVTSRFGNFISIDLSDPTQPAVGSALFNDNYEPSGEGMPEDGGTLVTDDIAYVTGLTPGGGDVVSNTGNLLVVNVADPTNMSVINSLTVPGTNDLVDVAMQGNRALVIGSAGPESGTYNPNATGVFDNLSLTLLDVTDPSNPQILGQTFVTPEQFPVNEAGQKTDVVSLGDGDFAVSDTDANGNPALLVIDPSDPSNMIVGAAQVPSGVHGITVSGDMLYASTSAGLSIYQIQPLISDPVTITANLPAGAAANIVPGSFNVQPTEINTSSTGDSLVWDRSFAAGNTTYTFTWQTTVSGVQAGQTVPVTTGASASYVSQGTPGTLTLPGTSVTGASIINISPASQTSQPGGTASYDLRLINPSSAQDTYYLDIQGLRSDWTTNLPGSATIPADGAVDLALALTSGVSDSLGTTSFTVTADDGHGAAGSAQADLALAGQPVLVPDPESHGIVATLTPAQATAGQGTSAQYVVQLTNTGSADDTFSLAATGLPSGVTATFGESTIDVPPGASNFRDVTLTLTTQTGTAPASYPFTVTAASATDPSVTTTAHGTLTVVAAGVQVSLTPGSGAPGSSFQATVTNTGTSTDTYKLALAGPAALVASLGMKQVTLAPGASQVVPITTGAVNFADQGNLNLMASATSASNPAIEDAATANLAIPSSQGMTASFSPASKTLPKPGMTTFLLLVHNTGNTQDSYSATIMGPKGPVTATLVGLDGSPTQSIPTFILPGLSTGAIELQADLSKAGTGTVTVEVQSLTNAGITASPSATVVAAAVAAKGPQVTDVQRFGYHMMPTTVVLTFDQALNAISADNPENYQIIGPAGRQIRVKSAAYNPANDTVTLHPSQRINIHHRYTLVVDGKSAGAISNTQGQSLDSQAGDPGSNYRTSLTWRNLVLDPRSPKSTLRSKSSQLMAGRTPSTTTTLRRSQP